ncbi:Phosphotransferase system, lactose/cellobiose-specific IIB subunit [Latilactobacillus fuchuensis]|uniref:Phosphotransferase system, lactose/cellobiose-specific IIB subunit n=3 Tax=Latilactobacillus fuchuensis TaxID=164393 RepID=A0A2N9DXC0_9LACO|nr:PTS sugar transporter subunit IIB [Latilactobacillus fuchuensis]KRL60454.1 hypothetical protein FC69_GL001291 [Latilactobacillus fuchuensis DSM 14340 = JCM 11249]SPC39320.1 Phosphotransferase system, lactose/cellobiose-specific IIB subunit [Latilactobacillus fuchuensis]
MMNIVLCCAGGFSTTMMMEKIKDVIRESKKLQLEDFNLKAISADLLQDETEPIDVVLIGPQIAHREEYIRSIIEPKGTAYAIMDKDTYGKMDGATALKMALIADKKNKAKGE